MSWLSGVAQLAHPLLFMVAVLTGSPWFAVPAFLAFGFFLAGSELGWQTSLMAMAPPAETSALVSAFFLTVGVLGVGSPFIGGALLVAGEPILAFAVALDLIAAGNLLLLRFARGFTRLPDNEPAEVVA